MNWDMIGSLADWFAAIGTIAAVVLALRIRWRDVADTERRRRVREVAIAGELSVAVSESAHCLIKAMSEAVEFHPSHARGTNYAIRSYLRQIDLEPILRALEKAESLDLYLAQVLGRLLGHLRLVKNFGDSASLNDLNSSGTYSLHVLHLGADCSGKFEHVLNAVWVDAGMRIPNPIPAMFEDVRARQAQKISDAAAAGPPPVPVR